MVYSRGLDSLGQAAAKSSKSATSRSLANAERIDERSEMNVPVLVEKLGLRLPAPGDDRPGWKGCAFPPEAFLAPGGSPHPVAADGRQHCYYCGVVAVVVAVADAAVAAAVGVAAAAGD